MVADSEPAAAAATEPAKPAEPTPAAEEATFAEAIETVGEPTLLEKQQVIVPMDVVTEAVAEAPALPDAALRTMADAACEEIGEEDALEKATRDLALKEFACAAADAVCMRPRPAEITIGDSSRASEAKADSLSVPSQIIMSEPPIVQDGPAVEALKLLTQQRLAAVRTGLAVAMKSADVGILEAFIVEAEAAGLEDSEIAPARQILANKKMPVTSSNVDEVASSQRELSTRVSSADATEERLEEPVDKQPSQEMACEHKVEPDVALVDASKAEDVAQESVAVEVMDTQAMPETAISPPLEEVVDKTQTETIPGQAANEGTLEQSVELLKPETTLAQGADSSKQKEDLEEESEDEDDEDQILDAQEETEEAAEKICKIAPHVNVLSCIAEDSVASSARKSPVGASLLVDAAASGCGVAAFLSARSSVENGQEDRSPEKERVPGEQDQDDVHSARSRSSSSDAASSEASSEDSDEEEDEEDEEEEEDDEEEDEEPSDAAVLAPMPPAPAAKDLRFEDESPIAQKACAPETATEMSVTDSWRSKVLQSPVKDARFASTDRLPPPLPTAFAPQKKSLPPVTPFRCGKVSRPESAAGSRPVSACRSNPASRPESACRSRPSSRAESLRSRCSDARSGSRDAEETASDVAASRARAAVCRDIPSAEEPPPARRPVPPLPADWPIDSLRKNAKVLQNQRQISKQQNKGWRPSLGVSASLPQLDYAPHYSQKPVDENLLERALMAPELLKMNEKKSRQRQCPAVPKRVIRTRVDAMDGIYGATLKRGAVETQAQPLMDDAAATMQMMPRPLNRVHSMPRMRASAIMGGLA
jgi:hypothetical protein